MSAQVQKQAYVAVDIYLAVPFEQSCDAICELTERSPGDTQHLIPDSHNGYMIGKRGLLREKVFESKHQSCGKDEGNGDGGKCDIVPHGVVVLVAFQVVLYSVMKTGRPAAKR